MRFPRRLLLTIATIAFAGSTHAAPATAPSSKVSDTASTYEMLNLFGEVFDRVRTDYVEPTTDEKLIESALNGMLTALDPHSSYLTQKQFDEMKVQTKGEFGGLGIEVTMDNGLVKVVSPIDETPAAKAGVKPNDYISEIDGTPVMGLTLNDAVEKMRGAVGTSVKITIIREGAKEPILMTLKRDLIKIKSVRSRAEDDVAYLRVTSFSENTADILKAAFDEQKKAIGPKLKGVVLDLRNNPGGLLDQAIEVSDLFLDHGEIVSTRSRKPEDSRRYTATGGDVTGGLPMVVLINEGSASASEIVAGALKDHKRAVALGMKSFGKGSVQTVIPIEAHGAIRLTTARYYTPSGVSIQAKGIEPDIQVAQAKVEVIKNNSDYSEASLKGHLGNDQEGTKPAEEKLPFKDSTETPKDSLTKDKPADEDYQLSRALDLIRAVSIYKQTLNWGHAPVAAAENTIPAPAPLAVPAVQALPAAAPSPFGKKK